MLGVTTALEKVLLSGRALSACDARAIGLLDEVVAHRDDLLRRAKSWIARNPDAVQPWDVKGFAIPGGTPAQGALAAQLPFLGANLRKTTAGAPAPAERAILAVAVEGSQVDLDTACRLESRHFVQIAVAPIAKNKMRLNFVDIQEIKGGASRPQDQPAFRCERLGVIGAGMMGAGIAYVAAQAGIDVVLVDTDLANAERGKDYAAKQEGKRVAAGRTSVEAADAVVGRIRPSSDLADLSHVDFLVEAVFENADLKAGIFAQAEKVVPPTAVLGSNTSTLPISALAGAVGRPADFIGVHFFSPVDKMPLVEIIKGAETSPATLAKAFDLVRQIGKTPIVVNDGRGFFTSRVIIARLNEAVAMLGDGVPAASIEQASLQAGYPAGALQLLDELTLTLPRQVREEGKAAAAAAGEAWVEHPSHPVFDLLIDQHQRAGRTSGGGFYDYDASGRRTTLWPGLREHFGSDQPVPALVDLRDRLLFAEALEAWAAHCSGVIEASADANVGSLLGIGFPAWTGGVLRFITEHPGGTAAFVARSRALAASYGERFDPPASLVTYAEGISA
jgi:3-hydroxyacyl-CoA dehydrogenase/enoyl-CoA hydratase/3-hydroxybutyryl-CoA epimerase